MRRTFLFSAVFAVLAASCASTPPAPSAAEPAVQAPAAPEPAPIEVPVEAEPEPVAVPAPEPEPEVEPEPFDPSTISREVFETTKADLQDLIGSLNAIVRAKDYDAWTAYLAPSYRDALSDPETLARTSESSVLKKQGIVLKSLRDFFFHVVVPSLPSHANARVDDIEFIGPNVVKAFNVTSKGVRIRLYVLEKKDGGWKIVD